MRVPAPGPEPHRNRGPLYGILLKVLATFFFGVLAAFIKLLGDQVPVGQVVFFRSFFALVPIAVYMTWRGQGPSSLLTQRPGAHALRSGAGLIAMFSNFAALMLLPLADVVAIGFATPLVTVILAATLLGETVRFYRWSAVAIGFAGVMIMLTPHLGQTDGNHSSAALGAVLALLSAVAAALAMIFIRRMSGQEPATRITFYFQMTCALASLLTWPFGWIAPDWSILGLLISIGLLGGVGQLLMTHSYDHADASTIAPLEYVAMIWAVIFGFLLFSDVPGWPVLIGGAIVIASGLMIIWRERQLGLARRAMPLSPDGE